MFIELKKLNDSQPILINLNNVATIEEFSDQTYVYFHNQEESYIKVIESLEIVKTMIESATGKAI